MVTESLPKSDIEWSASDFWLARGLMFACFESQQRDIQADSKKKKCTHYSENLIWSGSVGCSYTLK